MTHHRKTDRYKRRVAVWMQIEQERDGWQRVADRYRALYDALYAETHPDEVRRIEERLKRTGG